MDFQSGQPVCNGCLKMIKSIVMHRAKFPPSKFLELRVQTKMYLKASRHRWLIKVVWYKLALNLTYFVLNPIKKTRKTLTKQIFVSILAHFLSSVNVIIRLMLSLLVWPKVITLSGFYCNNKLFWYICSLGTMQAILSARKMPVWNSLGRGFSNFFGWRPLNLSEISRDL